MGMMTKEYYITLIEKMVESTRQQWYQGSLFKTVLKEMHDHFGHFGIGQNILIDKDIITGLK